MLGENYIVKTGDNLWDIAEQKFGNGSQWPRIWRYNNRAEVIQATGRGIPDPDLIYPGQLLLIPVIPGSGNGPAQNLKTSVQKTVTKSAEAQAPKTSSSPGPLSRLLPNVKSPIVFKYHLEDLKFPPIPQPGAIVEVKMSGDLLMKTKDSYPALYVTQQRQIEAKVSQQAAHTLGALINEATFNYDVREKKLTYRSMLVSRSNLPNAACTAIGVQVDSGSMMPKLRFEYRFPKLSGTINDFVYTGFDIKIIIEITPKPEQLNQRARPLAQPQQSKVDWGKVIGVGLLVSSVVIVVAALADDVVGGVPDDPPAFAAAAAVWIRGMSMIRGVAAALPAAAPTAVTFSMRFAPAR